MLNNIKITILTATFNCDQTLEQTISSVVNQDYPNIEYIIIDGESTDKTVDIIKKYSKYGIRWISEPDEGLYDALNKGVNLSTGDYIQIIGADDALYNRTTISNVVAKITPDIDILSAVVKVVDEKSCKSYIYPNQHAKNKKKYSGGMIPHQGMFVKSSILKKYKFDNTYKIAADYKFFLQCYYNESLKFKFIDEPVAFFANNGLSGSLEVCWKENNRLYKELGLPFHDSYTSSGLVWKRIFKILLMKMNLLMPLIAVKRWHKKNFLWEKHHCHNKICRWCGRM